MNFVSVNLQTILFIHLDVVNPVVAALDSIEVFCLIQATQGDKVTFLKAGVAIREVDRPVDNMKRLRPPRHLCAAVLDMEHIARLRIYCAGVIEGNLHLFNEPQTAILRGYSRNSFRFFYGSVKKTAGPVVQTVFRDLKLENIANRPENDIGIA